MLRSGLGVRRDDMPRSFDVGATRSAGGSRRSMRETPACDAYREIRTSGVRACGSAGGFYELEVVKVFGNWGTTR